MRDRFSESELLAFIEDELSPKKRLVLAARLERDPALRERVERMRDDRTAPRALPEPELPVDFLAALEPQLARPMLVSATPGAYRRRHRQSVRRRVGRLAIAAVFAAALFGGIWGATVLLPRLLRAPAGTGDVARGPTSPASEAPGPRSDAPEATTETRNDGALVSEGADGEFTDFSWPPPNAVVHHRGPLPPRRSAEAEAPASMDVAAARVIPEAPLALVVPVSDAAEGEALVRRLVAELALPAGADSRRTADARGAVVRNFSMDEAQRLVQRLESERLASGGAPDTIAGLDGGAGHTPRRRVLARLRRLGDRPIDADPRASARLLGPAALSPDYERQLELSALGATHTVTLPIDALSEFLGRLRVAEGRLTTIRPLTPQTPSADAKTELQRWVENHVLIRDFASALGATTGDGYVMLPVVIEVDD